MLPIYMIDSLPAGYQLTAAIGTDTRQVLYNGPDGFIRLNYQYPETAPLPEWNSPEYVHVSSSVAGRPADYHRSIDPDGVTSTFLWTDEASGIVFYISVRLDEAAMITLAKNIKLSDKSDT